MKYLKIILISSLILLSTTTHSYSQSRVGIHLGSAFPLSEFGLYGFNEFMAEPTIGLNTGVNYSYIFSTIGIGAYSAIDFIYNGISKEYRDEVEKYELPLMGEMPVYHKYFNIPFSIGVCYDHRLNDNLLLSSNAGFTVNCFIITDTDLGLFISSTEPAFSLGGRIGAGLIIKERVSINLDYLGLGSHTVEGESIWGASMTKEEFSTDLKIHMLTLTAGINF